VNQEAGTLLTRGSFPRTDGYRPIFQRRRGASRTPPKPLYRRRDISHRHAWRQGTEFWTEL